MTMPHPKCTMIPFGCVIIQSKATTGTGMTIDIYRDEVEIGKRHDAFKRTCANSTKSLATHIFMTEDDAGTQPSPDHCGVIAYTSSTVVNQYRTWQVKKGSPPATIPNPVYPPPGSLDLRIVLDSGWYYFLLPHKVKPIGAKLDSDIDEDEDNDR